MNAAAQMLAAWETARARPVGRLMDPGATGACDREWKRAEVAAWFRGTPSPPEPSADRLFDLRDRVDAPAYAGRYSAPAMAPAWVSTAPMSKLEPGAAASTSIGGCAGMTAARATPCAASAQSQLPHGAGELDLPSVAPSSACGAARATSSSRPAAAPAAPATHPVRSEPARAVHVHIERDADGVRVWLGIPGSEQGAALRANVLVSELRRSLAAEGYRCCAVICNGASLGAVAQTAVTRSEQDFKEQQ